MFDIRLALRIDARRKVRRRLAAAPAPFGRPLRRAAWPPSFTRTPIFARNSDRWGIHILNHSTCSTKRRKTALAIEYFSGKPTGASLNGRPFFFLWINQGKDPTFRFSENQNNLPPITFGGL